jgi:hypothetical protein
VTSACSRPDACPFTPDATAPVQVSPHKPILNTLRLRLWPPRR